jgi:hypothetical protein
MKLFKFFLFCFFLLFLTYLLSRVFLLDVSQNDLTLTANPDLKNAPSRAPVYLVSYADGDEIYFRNQNALSLSALGRGIDYIQNYKRSLLDPSFLEANKSIMNMSHGRGLWLWKPYIILDAMKKAPDGAMIIYADTGFIFQKEVSDLLEKLNDCDIMLVQYSDAIDGTIQTRIQRKTLELMKAPNDSDFLNRNIMLAGFCVFRNSKISRAFVKSWLENASDPRKLANHRDDNYPEHPSFTGHHYDLAILTLLAYQEKAKIHFISDTDLLKYAVWHHRSNRESLNDRSAFDKLYFYLRPVYGFFSSSLKIARGVINGNRSLSDLFYQPFFLLYGDLLSAINRLRK